MTEKIYSQNEEQSILQDMIDKFDIHPTAVEIGINTGAKGDGTTLQGNTVFLKDRGWFCLWIDGQTQFENVIRKKIYPENIGDVLKEHLEQQKIGIFSIDIDSEDWYVVKATLDAGYQPDIFVCETNSYLNPLDDLVMPIGHRRTPRPKSICHGGTLKAFDNLLSTYGYNFYTSVKLGVNGFWIHNSICKDKNDPELFKDNRHPRTTNWSRSSPADVWTSSEILLA